MKQLQYYIEWCILVSTLLVVNVSCDKEPNPPLATVFGEAPFFDAVLEQAEQSWIFVFTTNTQMMATDIYGKTDQPLLDITEVSAENPSATFWGAASLSPDGRYVVRAFCKTPSASQCGQTDGQFIVVDVLTREWKSFSVDHDEQRIDRWFAQTYWLNDTTFLLEMETFARIPPDQPGVVPAHQSFLSYTIEDVWHPQRIDLHTDNPVACWREQSSALLFADTHTPTPNEWHPKALDAQGERAVTPQEHAFFNNGCAEETSPSSFPQFSVQEVEVKRQTPQQGGYWDQRYAILLDKTIVRYSEGPLKLRGYGYHPLEIAPGWDQALQLLIWHEMSPSEEVCVYYMDRKGHYHFWHRGHYVGKRPKP